MINTVSSDSAENFLKQTTELLVNIARFLKSFSNRSVYGTKVFFTSVRWRTAFI